MSSSDLRALYPDALLAHYSYKSSTASSGKSSVAGEGSARKHVSQPEQHTELQPRDRHEPQVQGPPRNVISCTGHKRPGSPVAVYVPEVSETKPSPLSEPLSKEHSPLPGPFECGRYGYLPATATAIVLTACLLATLAFAIRAEESPPEAAPLVNTSALRAGDDCPCRHGALAGGALVGPSDDSTKNVVAVTKRKAMSVQHPHRFGSNGKSSAAHPPMTKAKAHTPPSDSVGRVVPVNPGLYAVGDPSPPSRVPEETTRPHKGKATTGSERGQATRGSATQSIMDDSVAEVMPSMTLSPEDIEAGGEHNVQEV